MPLLRSQFAPVSYQPLASVATCSAARRNRLPPTARDAPKDRDPIRRIAIKVERPQPLRRLKGCPTHAVAAARLRHDALPKGPSSTCGPSHATARASSRPQCCSGTRSRPVSTATRRRNTRSGRSASRPRSAASPDAPKGNPGTRCRGGGDTTLTRARGARAGARRGAGAASPSPSSARAAIAAGSRTHG